MTQSTWQRVTQWPLLGVSVAFLAAYSIQVIADVPARAGTLLDIVLWGTWAVFIADFVVNLLLAADRRHWFVHNAWQLAILALPALRPLRLLQLVNVLRVARHAGGNALRGRLLTYMIGAAAILVYVGSLAVLGAEQNVPGSTIKNFGDALWWAIFTMTTVGFGDYSPVTVTGRLVAVGLIISGIAVIGVVTASIASWLVEQVGDDTAKTTTTTDSASEVAELRQDIARLIAQVDELAKRPALMPGPPSPDAADGADHIR